MGSTVKEKGGEMKKKTREERRRSTRKDVLGCVQYVVGKKKF